MRQYHPASRFLRHLSNLSDSSYSFERALVLELRGFIQKRNTPETVALDFGCGSKPLSFVFEGFSGVYKGIDIYDGEKVDIVYDGNVIPLEDESVDLIFASSVFEHIEHLDKTLCEIKRVLRHGGEMIAVVPFMGHCHGTPYDFNRPTRYGWQALCRRTFGPQAQVEVRPVDSRISCLSNMITSQINFMLLDLIRLAVQGGRKQEIAKSEPGGVTLARRNPARMRVIYFLLRLNPINFLLGLLSWTFSRVPLSRPSDGEITSGYLIKVTKR
jgi:SAM-dependent methyltransferase